jgi:hypothetical protein
MIILVGPLPSVPLLRVWAEVVRRGMSSGEIFVAVDFVGGGRCLVAWRLPDGGEGRMKRLGRGVAFGRRAGEGEKDL